ncbi:MAG: M20/M25/M40 family metallo-hydrolase [Proteobacteria bacterium]|nr:M20/M25/M40 family metallo-hydrolase [Pseudomonadota bacterium]
MSEAMALRAYELSLLLTSWPSVTGTADEARLPQHLADALSHFDKAWIAAIPGDHAGRSNVFALKRGRSQRTVVLTGHFDTVPFDDYGDLAELALKPEQLTAALLAKLASGTHPLARADLESGDYLPGRGLLDMKAGLAAGIAAMEHYDGALSLLFLGVSDEEERSAGARAAIPQLRAAAAEHGLEIALIINLDSISDQGDGSKGRVVTYGSIGKQLLCAHVVGKQTHAGYPQDGVNAAYLMAELVRAIELAPELSEATGDEIAALPATLFAKDGKQGYNVTTPAHAFAYWNTMQHRRSGAEVLNVAETLAAKAVAAAEARTGHKIRLTRFAELGLKAQITDPSLSLPDQTALAMTALAQQADINAPTVLLGFASIPYPAVLLRDEKLRNLISAAIRPHGLGEVNYFAGISDMSFYGEASGDLSVVADNTPIWGTGFTMPDSGGWPCINIGPWGRDYHTWLERLHAPYAFETLPKVLLSVIAAIEKSG